MALRFKRPSPRPVHRESGKWMGVPRLTKVICCDCSLVHWVEFRVRDGMLESRVTRDDRSTSARRRKTL
jgi:hypothetical protein